ncbi:MAG TPA: hypothetical protein VIZ18_08925, partial [Ktedonobacteraceae bacterium]
LNAMYQLARLTRRGHEVVPTPRDVQAFAQSEDAVGDGIVMVMVVKEPAVELGLSQSFLNCLKLHISADSISAISWQMLVAAGVGRS